MPLPEKLREGLAIPAIAAPMFLVSSPDLVVEACRSGIIGTFPSLNQRTSDGYEVWLSEIKQRLKRVEAETGRPPAPYGVNLIVHKTNARLNAAARFRTRAWPDLGSGRAASAHSIPSGSHHWCTCHVRTPVVTFALQTILIGVCIFSHRLAMMSPCPCPIS